ncbi:MAG: TonB-dependent receptor [Rubricoccaceae bacterium]|nr:TonB-dependent receptor [Rubricoccaceae bacterium]
MHRRFLAFAFLSGAAGLSATPGLAQPAPPDTTLPAVTVTAARVPVPTRDAPARVTVLDRAAVEATGAVSVADVLERRASGFVRRYGGGLATMSLRGAASAQTLLLLDGRRLTDPQLGPLDLSLLPTVLLESVEVLHGGGASLYGSDALGGVVHLQALRPTGEDRVRLVSEAGAWGQRRLAGAATADTGAWRAVAAVEAEGAESDYRYRETARVGAPLVANDGWDRRRLSGYTALAWSDGPWRVRTALLAADAERGLGGTDSVGARQWDRHARGWLDATYTARWGRLEAGGYAQHTRLRYASPFPAGDRPDALDETGRTLSAGMDARAHVQAVPGWTLTGLASVGLGRAEHPSLDADALDRHAALAVSAAPTSGRLRLYPALRLDAYAPAEADRRLVPSPSLGLNLQPAADERLRLKASLARSFRMPTLNDRYWRPGGNAALRPERGWSADAGLVWGGRVRAELTAFAATAQDQIVWRPTGAGYWAPENVARTRSLGVEASAEGAWALGGAVVEAGVRGAFTDARDRSDPTARSFDQPLRYVPRLTSTAWTALGRGPLRLDLGARYVGRRATTTDASQSLDPYLVLDGQLRYTRRVAGVDATLGLAVENLTDRRYEPVQSYVMPPRHLRVRLLLQTR